MDLDDPTAVALAAADALGRAGAAHALYGGLLLAAYGAPRETRDADLAVAGAGVEAVARELAVGGVSARVAFERTRFGGLWVSAITLNGGESADGLDTVDLVEPRGIAYAERALGRSLDSTLRGQRIRLLSPEDFVVFKVLSTREQDRIDAASVLRALGHELDREALDAELDTLREELADEPIAERWSQVRGLV